MLRGEHEAGRGVAGERASVKLNMPGPAFWAFTAYYAALSVFCALFHAYNVMLFTLCMYSMLLVLASKFGGD